MINDTAIQIIAESFDDGGLNAYKERIIKPQKYQI